MEQMGPEALMLTAAAAGRRELGQFARLEYSDAEAPRAERSLLREFEAQPAKRSVARNLFRWGATHVRREVLVPTGASPLVVMAATAVAADPAVRLPSMAQLPAQEWGRKGGGSAPLSALPIPDRI